MYQAFIDAAWEHWGEPIFAEELAPGPAHGPEFREWWAAALRVSMSRGTARAMLEMNAAIDVRAALPGPSDRGSWDVTGVSIVISRPNRPGGR